VDVMGVIHPIWILVRIIVVIIIIRWVAGGSSQITLTEAEVIVEVGADRIVEEDITTTLLLIIIPTWI